MFWVAMLQQLTSFSNEAETFFSLASSIATAPTYDALTLIILGAFQKCRKIIGKFLLRYSIRAQLIHCFVGFKPWLGQACDKWPTYIYKLIKESLVLALMPRRIVQLANLVVTNAILADVWTTNSRVPLWSVGPCIGSNQKVTRVFAWCFQWREIKLAVISHNFSGHRKIFDKLLFPPFVEYTLG